MPALSSTQVVWFKRDLRVTDHAPLLQASTSGPVLAMYVHEPAFVQEADCSRQHTAFLRECLNSLQHQLAALGGELVEEIGAVVDVFERVWQKTHFSVLWAHQETTTGIAFARDKAVAAWCARRGVVFREVAHSAVLRGRAFTEVGANWNQHFRTELFSSPLPSPKQITRANYQVEQSWPTPTGSGSDKSGRVTGGRETAEKLLDSFLPSKLLGYRNAISSPLTAVQGCSRLSPYFALGVMSTREVAAAMLNVQAAAKISGEHTEQIDDALQFYVERLYWRSAYLQQFELDPSLEFVSQHPGTRGLRENEFNEKWFERWLAAETGYPFIDAGLRMLAHTGWVNMRLRGTLISFAVNELWLHWREPALHLAREFLDYEPGIHYSQMQIHAGTSLGTHPLMYNPVKQAQDHDPRGAFVKQWCPELAKVPLEFIFEPWKMPRAVQAGCSVHIGREYPAPVVPHEAAGHAARMLVTAAREYRPAPALAYSRLRLEGLKAQRQGDLF